MLSKEIEGGNDNVNTKEDEEIKHLETDKILVEIAKREAELKRLEAE
jgi:hypothetical protein